MPLVIDLVRHGEALPAGPGGDAGRPLSPAGERAVRELAHVFAREGWKPDRVLTSPLKRARDTARLLVEQVAPALEPVPLDALLPDHEPDEVVHELAAQGLNEGHIVVVGHQPLLGAVVGNLAGGRERSLVPAELVRIACDGAPARRGGRIVLERRPES